jgi:hypothetical protein
VHLAAQPIVLGDAGAEGFKRGEGHGSGGERSPRW